MMFGYGAGWAVLMGIGMLGFFAMVIWVCYVVAGGDSRRGDGSRSSRSAARDVLDGRLVRGDIDTDEYRHLVDTIKADDRRGINARS